MENNHALRTIIMPRICDALQQQQQKEEKYKFFDLIHEWNRLNGMIWIALR